MLSQIRLARRYIRVNAIADEMQAGEARLDLEAVFRACYGRVARVIARVVRDPARAEELAVEVFLKLWRNPLAPRGNPIAWLHRAAVRAALDELRRRTRRQRYERQLLRPVATPEQIRAAAEEQERVRLVLAALARREAELLVLRSDGLRYDEIAAALRLNPASVGTLLIRAQNAFRKEYVQRYGEQ